MAGTYGESGVSYGQASGTYGSWGSGSSASNGSLTALPEPLPRETDNRFSTQYGYLTWWVTLTGTGTVDHADELNFLRSLQPTGTQGDLRFDVSDRYDLAATADLSMVVEGRSAFHLEPEIAAELAMYEFRQAGEPTLTATGFCTLTLDADLRHVTDPPELLELLELRTSHG